MVDTEEQVDDVEVEPRKWVSFLDGFSQQHEGWLASIEVSLPSGKLTEVVDRRLRGVTIDHSDGKRRLYVAVGDAPDECLTHVVDTPTQIRFKRTPTGAHRGLDIVSVDGSTTRVRFRSAMLPEMLDGIAS
ncbi:MAG: DUF5335 family protein [Terriglobales bacterium]